MDLSKLRKGVARPLDCSVEDVLDRLDVQHLGVTANGEIPFRCVVHEDDNPSASINTGSGLWLCHGCGEKGNLHQLISRVLKGDDARELIAQLPDLGRTNGAVKFKPKYDIGPIEPYDPAPSEGETYDYTDENGKLLYQVLRPPSSGKRFQQRRPDGKGGWTYNLTQTRVPYRLPQVLAAVERGDLIFICEGEKDVHAFEEAGLVATCNSGGAGKFHQDFGHWYFRSAKVAIVADRDQKGIEHALDVKAKLERYADDVFLVLPAHGKDAADHFHNGGKLSDLILEEDFSRYSQSQPPTESETASGSNGLNRSLKGTRLSDVEMVPMTWLFDGWIPDNSLSLFAGAGGIGKSTFLTGLAAILSTGRDQKINGGVPATSIIFTAEDDIASALVPRLTAAGADLERIFTYEVQNEAYSESLLFPRDIDLLSQALTATQAKLVILDPGNSYLGVDNAHADVDMRRALSPLAGLASKHGCAIIFMIHLNKNKGGALTFRDRIIGSVGSVNAARSVLGMALHPENEGEIVLAHAKHNYSAAQKSLVFRLEEVSFLTTKGEPITTTKMVKTGDTDLTADDLVAPKERGNPKLSAAITFVEEQLSNGPTPSSLFNAAYAEAGHSDGMITKAKKLLGVVSKRHEGTWLVGIEGDF